MNTDKIKIDLKKLLGKEVSLKVNVGRNKYEYYSGIITGLYPSIFTVRVNNIVKSFTYSDVLTKDVQFKITNT